MKITNPFKLLWYSVAYIQAYFDDTILYITKKLQNKAEKEKNPEELKKIHKKILYYTWLWLSKSIWESVWWYYEKYKELKKWKNMVETTFEEDIPRLRIKTKNLKTRLELKWIKKWSLEDLKKLKDKKSFSKTSIEKFQKTKKELKDIQNKSIEALKKLKDKK